MKINSRHILVKYEYEAQDIQKKLETGFSFDELARKFSICPSARFGGSLGLLSTSRLDDAYADVLVNLKLGEISKPIRTRYGWHLVQRLS